MSLQTVDASSDRIAVAAASSINDQTAFSTLQWVYLTAFTSGRRMWSKGEGTKNLAMEFNNTPNGLFFDVARATTGALASTNNNQYSNNAWTCICSTYDESDGPRVFIGSLTTALAEASYVTRDVGAGATNTDSANDLLIFNRGNLNGAPAGRVGEFMYWNRRLTLGELRTHQWRPHASSGLVVWHNYNEGTGTQRDYSGAKNTGTVTGATALANHVPLPAMFGGDLQQSYVVSTNPSLTPTDVEFASEVTAGILSNASSPITPLDVDIGFEVENGVLSGFPGAPSLSPLDVEMGFSVSAPALLLPVSGGSRFILTRRRRRGRRR